MRTPIIGTLAVTTAMFLLPACAEDRTGREIEAGNMDSTGTEAPLPPGQLGVPVNPLPAPQDEEADAVASDEAESPPVTDDPAEAPPLGEASANRVAIEPDFLADGVQPEPVEQPTVPPRE